MISQEFIWIIKTVILPPGGLLLLAFVGLLLCNQIKGKLLLLLSIGSLYLLSTNYLSGQLAKPLETIPALTQQQIKTSDAQAILVLCGGREERAAEYGHQDTSNTLTLERIRYAAYIAKQTSLTVYPTGGSPLSDGPSEAALAANILSQELAVKTVVLEEQSRTTWENAQIVSPLLLQRGIQKVFLVTHAWHMQRSLEAFRESKLIIIPAPMAFASSTTNQMSAHDWLPSASALQISAWAIHEHIGRRWYQLKRAYGL